MRIFGEHDLYYWFERCMLLAVDETEDLNFRNGDASFTALAANFINIVSTVILDREGLDISTCSIYGTNKGEVSLKKVQAAIVHIEELLRARQVGVKSQETIINAISSMKKRSELKDILKRELQLSATECEKLSTEISKAVHPARIALANGCTHWRRSMVEKEYLVDFSVHYGARMLVALESEGVHVTKSSDDELEKTKPDTIYWDFFKLLNVKSKYKFLMAVENSTITKERIRSSLKKLLDQYFEQNENRSDEQIWIFIFHPTEKRDKDKRIPEFDMYNVETDKRRRKKMEAQAIESFLRPPAVN